jgi:hypothetical protein
MSLYQEEDGLSSSSSLSNEAKKRIIGITVSRLVVLEKKKAAKIDQPTFVLIATVADDYNPVFFLTSGIGIRSYERLPGGNTYVVNILFFIGSFEYCTLCPEY